MDGTTDEALDRLYAASPDRFTAERDALAKSLRATDKAAAAAVKALRRPTVTAWALNQVARDQAGDLSALFDADAELSGRSGKAGAGTPWPRRPGTPGDHRSARGGRHPHAGRGGHPDSPPTGTGSPRHWPRSPSTPRAGTPWPGAASPAT